MQHKPYNRNATLGYVGPFATREQAQLFLDFAIHCGCDAARIAPHSSQVMTSDNSPIVVNVTAACVARFNDAVQA